VSKEWPSKRPNRARVPGTRARRSTIRRGFLGAVVFIGSAVSSATLFAPDASASPSVSIAASYPGPVGSFASVACPTSSECVAVGTGTGQDGIAATYGSGGWTVVPVPQATALDSVSCASATLCVAVGSGPQEGLASVFDGTGWSTSTVSGTSALSSVSCVPGGTTCVAAGWFSSSGALVGVVAEFQGGSFTTDTVAGTSQLFGVSCISSASCVAAGEGPSGGIVASLSGGGWSASTVSGTSVLEAVSCAVAGECAAVGASGNGAAVAVSQAGGWSSSTLSGASLLVAVDCPSASSCVAVGDDSASPSAGVVAGGTTTSPLWSATHVSGSSFLGSISCPTSSLCVAGGYGASSGVAVSGSGSSWSAVDVAGTAEVSSVSCPSSTSCEAVGYAMSGGASVATAELGTISGTSTSWSELELPQGASSLAASSCGSSTSCMVVGTGSTEGATASFEGTAWSSSLVGVAGTTELLADACPSSTECLAAGYGLSSGTQVGELAYWDGSAWSASALQGTAELQAVSCPAADYCVAAGFVDSSSGSEGVVAAGSPTNISGWSVVTVLGTSDLDALSCPSTVACAAAGGTDSSGSGSGPPGAVVAWFEPGSAAPTTVSIPGATFLYSVSCASSFACEAVGYSSSSGEGYLVGGSGSTWSEAALAGSSDLQSVSCPPDGSACEAVGSGGAQGSPEGLVAGGPPGSAQGWVGSGLPGSSRLDGVYCQSASECVAAGSAALSGSAEGVVGVGPAGEDTGWTSSAVAGTTGLVAPFCAGSGSCFALGTTGTGAVVVEVGTSSSSSGSGSGGSGSSGSGGTGSGSTGSGSTGSGGTGSSGTGSSGERYVPISPERICDTRPGNPSGLSGTALTQCEGKAPGPASVLTIQVAGLEGIPLSATAAAFSVTAVDPTASGYLSVFPAGGARPVVSNVNFTAGSYAVANLVTSSLSSDGEVSIYNYAGTTQVVVDVEGYFENEASSSSAGLFVPISPERICDTRPGNPSGLSGTALTQCEGKVASPGTPLQVQVAGVGSVPASGVEAAIVDITVIDPSSRGYVVASPAGGLPPLASNADYLPGEIMATSAVVALDATGAMEVTASAGEPAIALDVEGYFTSAAANPPAGASVLVPAASPARICDTRPGNPSGLSGTALTQCEGKEPGPGADLPVQVAGLGGVPLGATAAVVNLTVTGATTASYLTAYPGGSSPPEASQLNWLAGDTVANLAVVGLGTSGQMVLFNYAGYAQVVADVFGWAYPAS
jgi:hypothetical protein